MGILNSIADFIFSSKRQVAEHEDFARFVEEYDGLFREFANAHGLKYDKNLHEQTRPGFLFRHPKGGYCIVEMRNKHKAGGDLFTVKASWRDTDYDAMKSYWREETSAVLLRDKQSMWEAMEGMVKKVLSWNYGEWQHKCDFRKNFINQSVDEYRKKDDADILELPLPKV